MRDPRDRPADRAQQADVVGIEMVVVQLGLWPAEEELLWPDPASFVAPRRPPAERLAIATYRDAGFPYSAEMGYRRTVLIAGNGVSLEPRALAGAGFDVVALDVSPMAVEIAQGRDLTDELMVLYLDPDSTRAGGKATFVAGDLFDATTAPGPLDVVIERRTAQNQVEPRLSQLLTTLTARLSPDGRFVTRCHDGRWKPPATPRHVSAERWQAQGGRIWHGAGTQPAGRVAWPFTTTGQGPHRSCLTNTRG